MRRKRAHMKKGKVRSVWSKAFWGCCAGAILLLLPGLVVTLSMPVFIGLGAAAAALFAVGLVLAVRGLSCPFCKKTVYHQAMRAQEGIPFTCPKCGHPLELE